MSAGLRGMKAFGFAAAIASIAVPSPAFARDLTPEVRARLMGPTADVRLARPTVRVRMVGTDRHGFYKCPYFQAFVNGKGPFTFLFDTGSSYTLVSSKVIAAAGTPVVFDRGGKRDIVELANVTVGGVQLRNLWAVHDDSFDVDGIFGFRSFGSSNIVFDLAGRDLIVGKAPIPLRNGVELPFDASYNVPTIPVRIGSRTVPLLIDTGDDAYGLELRNSELGGASVRHPPQPAGSVINGANAQRTSVTTLEDEVGIGPFSARNAIVAVNDDLPIGDLGYDVLRQFRVEFEPARKIVVIQPLSGNAAFRIPPRRTLGFTVSFRDGAVGTIVRGSAAEAAGMGPGDRIVAIDGRDFSSITPRIWDALLHKGLPLEVAWIHDGKAHRARLPVRDMH